VNEVTQSMTSEDMDRHATLAMTVLFHTSGRRSGFMQVSPDHAACQRGVDSHVSAAATKWQNPATPPMLPVTTLF
jgi:hypothetical protein